MQLIQSVPLFIYLFIFFGLFCEKHACLVITYLEQQYMSIFGYWSFISTAKIFYLCFIFWYWLWSAIKFFYAQKLKKTSRVSVEWIPLLVSVITCFTWFSIKLYLTYKMILISDDYICRAFQSRKMDILVHYGSCVTWRT